MAFKDKADASKYVYQYTKHNYDRVNLLLPPGTKQAIKDRAGTQSVNNWIAEAIKEKLAKP